MWGISREKDKGLVLPAVIGGVPYQILLLYVELEWVADYHWLCHSVRFFADRKARKDRVRSRYSDCTSLGSSILRLFCAAYIFHDCQPRSRLSYSMELHLFLIYLTNCPYILLSDCFRPSSNILHDFHFAWLRGSRGICQYRDPVRALQLLESTLLRMLALK